jgi:hypothetical protein
MTSNSKLLLSAFLTVVLFIMAINISLFSKHDYDNFIIDKKDNYLSPHSLLSFPHIIIVSVQKGKEQQTL